MGSTLDDLELEFVEAEQGKKDIGSDVDIEFCSSSSMSNSLQELQNEDSTDIEVSQLAEARQKKNNQLRQLAQQKMETEPAQAAWPSEKEIELAITRYKVEFIKDLYAKFSITEHKVDRLMKMVYKKHPDVKRELMTIKKQLSDFRKKIS